MAVGDVVLSGSFNPATPWQSTGTDYYLSVSTDSNTFYLDLSTNGSTADAGTITLPRSNSTNVISDPTYVPTAYWRVRVGGSFVASVRSVPTRASVSVSVSA